jgi:hypothetical protein
MPQQVNVRKEVTQISSARISSSGLHRTDIRFEKGPKTTNNPSCQRRLSCFGSQVITCNMHWSLAASWTAEWIRRCIHGTMRRLFRVLKRHEALYVELMAKLKIYWNAAVCFPQTAPNCFKIWCKSRDRKTADVNDQS